MWAFLVLSHFLTLPLMRTVKVALSVSSSCLWCREGAGWFRSSHVVVTWLTFGIMPNLGLLFQDCLGVLGCLVSWLCSRLIPIRFDARHREETKRVMFFYVVFVFFSVWGSFPCYLLHFGAKISDLRAFATFWAKISDLRAICCILEPKSLIRVLFAAFWS